MKKFIKISLIAVGLMLACGSTAYSQKFGFIDTGELIAAMPEMDSVRVKLEALDKDLQDAYETMTVEFNNKVNDYTKALEGMSDAVRKIKEDELQKLRERIENFEGTAPTSIREEQNKLMAPVIEKARNAIQKVCKANGFTAVFDLSSSALAYHDETALINVQDLVKRELGI